MKLKSVILIACASICTAQQPEFRVDVSLIRLLATVKDNHGRPVGSLNREDFEIYDSGVLQKASLFERYTEQPLSIAILLDTSASTAKDLKYEMESLRRFAKAVFREGNSEDRLALYGFNWRVTLHTDYTRRLARLEDALKPLRGEAGTAMYDALYLASEELAEREGRHVIIVISDGGDTASQKDYHQALRAAHRADAVLYAIVVMPITNDAGRNTGGENALSTITESTGGKVFPQSGLSTSLDEAFSDILRDLRTQYLIAYYPKQLPVSGSSFRKVELRMKPPDLKATTRLGYFAKP